MTGTRVSVFIAGVQKGGTSSLHAYCVDHPQLVGARVKETHFFDDERVDWTSPDYGILEGLYDASATGQRCDGTPIYLFWPPAAQRILTYNPNARFILIFRDPIERAWSQWRMHFANGEETWHFADAIREGRARMPASNHLAQEWRVFSYVERGLYGAQMTRMLELVARDRVLLLRSEDLRRDPDTVLARVSTHLGIAPFHQVKRKTENEATAVVGAPQITVDDVAYLRGEFRADLERFAGLTGLDVSEWLTMQEGQQLPRDAYAQTLRRQVRRMKAVFTKQ